MTDEEKQFEEFDSLFYSDGFSIASAALKNGITIPAVLDMQAKIYKHVEDFLTMFTDQCWESDQNVDCKKGCSWCCYQSVMVLPQEAIFLNNFIKENKSSEEIASFKLQAENKNKVTSELNAAEFLHRKIKCPFLVDNKCAVYDARPMGCRLFLSSSDESCHAEFKDPKNKNVFPLLYEFPLRAGRLLNEGACAYLQQQDINPYEWNFESSFLIASSSKNNEDWLKGNNPFKVRDVNNEEQSYIDKFDVQGRD